MLTILIDGRVERQAEARISARAYWLQVARDDPRDVQVGETVKRVSHRLI